jgi:hypothetical protein
MAVRITNYDVMQVMGDTSLDRDLVDAVINTANLIVNKVYTGDTTLGEDLLTEIEKYYAAHLLACTVRRTTIDEKIGDAQVKYAGKFGTKLEMTPYGQIVLSLDPTGLMANAGKLPASMFAIRSFDE